MVHGPLVAVTILKFEQHGFSIDSGTDKEGIGDNFGIIFIISL